MNYSLLYFVNKRGNSFRHICEFKWMQKKITETKCEYANEEL